MIARNITKSKKIQQLSCAQRVMYAFILPFLDREGRINAHPTYLKGHVFLHLEYTEAEIDEAVRKFQDVGLATVYATEDDVVMEYKDFLVYNRPDRKEVASEYPAPSEEARTPVVDPNPPGIAAALPGQSRDNSVGEVEVEVEGEVEGEVEVEVEVEPQAKKNELKKVPPTPAQVRRQESFRLINRRLGTRYTNKPQGEEELGLVGECVAEGPTRDKWFDINPARVQELIQLAKKQQQQNPSRVYKTILIDLLDREAGTDTVTTTATPPPVALAPPASASREALMREALGDDVYRDLRRSSCSEPSTP